MDWRKLFELYTAFAYAFRLKFGEQALRMAIAITVIGLAMLLWPCFVFRPDQPLSVPAIVSLIIGIILAGLFGHIVVTWKTLPMPGRGEVDAQSLPSSENVQAQQLLEKAYSYVDVGELENALRECEGALELEPGWAEAHNLRGVILDDMGRAKEAIAAYREAVRLAPGFEEAVQNLAEAQEEERQAKPGAK